MQWWSPSALNESLTKLRRITVWSSGHALPVTIRKNRRGSRHISSWGWFKLGAVTYVRVVDKSAWSMVDGTTLMHCERRGLQGKSHQASEWGRYMVHADQSEKPKTEKAAVHIQLLGWKVIKLYRQGQTHGRSRSLAKRNTVIIRPDNQIRSQVAHCRVTEYGQWGQLLSE